MTKLSFTVLACFAFVFSFAREVTNTSLNKSYHFIENKGQIVDQSGIYRNDIDFKTSLKGLNVFVGKNGIHYQWMKQDSTANKSGKPSANLITFRLDMELINANLSAEISGLNADTYFERYYTPGEPTGMIVHSFKTVTYKNIYPNIDWVIYFSDDRLKYDFVVHQGGNVNDIKLKYSGATSINLDHQSLQVVTPFGSIREDAPYAYTSANEKVHAEYILKDNMVTFKTADYNGELIIDPWLEWAATFGGLMSNIEGITEDTANNTYVCGYTWGGQNVATSGAFQTTITGAVFDGFFSKFSVNGSLLWSTFYTGQNHIWLTSICTDYHDNIFVGGATECDSGITTPGSFKPSYTGSPSLTVYSEGFVAKFSGTGNRLWATYYGGDSEEGSNVYSDRYGYLYLYGWTNSDTGITTIGSFQPHKSLYSDGYIAKFTPSGNRLWGTYYGGKGSDIINGIYVDQSRNIYFIESTINGDTSLTTNGCYQRDTGSSEDAFIAKLDSNGNRIWATFYGGPGSETGVAIAGDNFNNIYIAGSTSSSSNMSTPNTSQTTFGGVYDLYLAKFTYSGNRIWSTYLGGPSEDQMKYSSGLYLSSLGYLYCTGYAISNSGIASPGAYQTTLGGGSDAILAKFDTSGKKKWSTYLGGSSLDYGYCVQVVNNRNIFLGGSTSSQNLATPGAFQTTFYGPGSDGFISLWSDDTVAYINRPFIDTALCAGDSLTINYTTTYKFHGGNNFSIELSDSSGSFSHPIILAMFAGDTTGLIKCKLPDTLIGNHFYLRMKGSSPQSVALEGSRIKIYQRVTSIVISNSPICQNDTLKFSATTTNDPNINFIWQGPNWFYSTARNPFFANAALNLAGQYICTTNYFACKQNDTLNVMVRKRPVKPVPAYNGPVCVNDSIKLSASNKKGTETYGWTNTNFASNAADTFLYPAAIALSGKYILIADSNNCTSTDTLQVTVKPRPVSPIGSSNTPVCTDSTIRLSFSSSTTGITYHWNGPNGFTDTAQNPTISGAKFKDSGSYIITTVFNGCTSTDTVNVSINPRPAIPTITANSPVCLNDTLLLWASDSTAGVTYMWTGPLNFQSTMQNPMVFNMTDSMAGTYRAYAILNGCTAHADTAVTIFQPNIPYVAAVVDNNNPGPWSTLNFTAIPTFGGNNPTYQWRKNDTDIPGATNAIYTAVMYKDLLPGDIIDVVMKSNEFCVLPDTAASNKLSFTIDMDIKKTTNDEAITIYPNPNKGRFSFITPTAGRLIIYNLQEQKVEELSINPPQTIINMNQISAGTYMGLFQYNNKVKFFKIDLVK